MEICQTISDGHVIKSFKNTYNFYEANHKCILLRFIVQHIQESCGLSLIKDYLTILYENNVMCITWIKNGYIY